MGHDPSPIKLQMLGREQLHTEGVCHVPGTVRGFCVPALARLTAHLLLELGWERRPSDSVDCLSVCKDLCEDGTHIPYASPTQTIQWSGF